MKTIFFAEKKTKELKKFMSSEKKGRILVLKDKYVLEKLPKKIKVIIWEKVLNKKERRKVDKEAVFLTRNWYRDKKNDFTKFDYLSLGKVFEYEILPFFIRNLKFITAAKKIIKQEKPNKIMFQTEFNHLFSKIQVPRIVLLKISKKKKGETKKEEILKKVIKFFLAKFVNRKKEENNKKNILLSSAIPELIPYFSRAKICSHIFVSNPNLEDDPAKGIGLIKDLKAKNKLVSNFNPKFKTDKWVRQEVKKIINNTISKVELGSYFDKWPGMNQLFIKYLKQNVFGFWPKIIVLKQQTEDYIKNESIKIIILENDVTTFNKTLVVVANNFKIPSLVVQHGILAEKNGHDKVNASELLAWGQASIDWYKQEDNTNVTFKITGNPKFDKIFNREYLPRNSFLSSFGLDPDKKTLVFASQPSGMIELSSFTDQDERENMLRAILKSAEKIKNLQLVVKIHPREDINYYQDIYKKMKLNKKIVTLKETDLHNLIKSADGVIVKDSTVGLEALMLDTKILSINLTLRNDKVPYVENEVATPAKNEKELQNGLTELLKPETREEQKKREIFVYNYNYRSDGKASERIAKYITSIFKTLTKS